MKPNMIKKLSLPLVLLGAAACATTIPRELVDARVAVRRAETGPAAERAPQDVEHARSALMRAEREFADDGDSKETLDHAYIAHRLAQIADVKARMEIAREENLRIKEQIESARAELGNRTAEELAEARAAQGAAQAEANAAKNAAASAEARAEAERNARKDAEMRVEVVIKQLEKIGEVKEEERGLVLNLSGSVLFTSGKSNLLPAAQERLLLLVDALRQMPNQKIIVEGHTDSVGSSSSNQVLSQHRAESVKNFLVRNGIEKDNIEAMGFGESRPVDENDTAEGRANNRRVEIVLERPSVS
jgi:outer membrane protein OmpA-like peptidoglycan-associated protein